LGFVVNMGGLECTRPFSSGCVSIGMFLEVGVVASKEKAWGVS